MLIIPSLGYIICENQLESLLVVSKIDLDLHNSTTSNNANDGIEMISTYAFCEPDHLFFPRPLWQYMLLLFATFRVAYPFILIKSDSYLRQKINFIVRYFVGSYNTNSYSRKITCRKRLTHIIFRFILHIMYYNIHFAVMTLKNEIPLEIWRGIRQQAESKQSWSEKLLIDSSVLYLYVVVKL